MLYNVDAKMHVDFIYFGYQSRVLICNCFEKLKNYFNIIFEPSMKLFNRDTAFNKHEQKKNTGKKSEAESQKIM
jgi:hypothetical protein